MSAMGPKPTLCTASLGDYSGRVAAPETPEVFISYARSTEAHAQQIAGVLRGQGYAVWWDEDLPAHRAYGDVIEERLKAAKAVVVIWSADAAKSQWVRAEADAARQSGTLVQLSIDGATPPMPFNQIQCPVLTLWTGDPESPGWRKVESSVAELVRGQGHIVPQPAPPVVKGISICVLPFANMSDDPEQEYFSDGITEDLITDLSQISTLGVVARNTSFTFKGRASEVTSVARQLNISHILEGSVRKAGSRLRITAQLVDGHSGKHLWAQRFDREMADIFDIQDEISKAIVTALRLKLLPSESGAEQRHTPEPAAYQAFLKGRHCWNRGTEESLNQAVTLFEQSLEHDPQYARAYAGLADAFVLMGTHTYLQPKAAYSRARTAAQKALSLDPDLADAHASLGLIAFVHDWDAENAALHLSRAVELDPASATARHHYSRFLSARGRHEEAIAQAEAALELDPLSVAAAVQLSTANRNAGRLEEAVRQLSNARSIFPDHFRVLYNLSFALAYVGEAERAVEAAERTIETSGRSMFALGALGYAKACAGASDEARAIAIEMERTAAERYVCPFDIAAIYAGLGDKDAALHWLEEGLEVRDHAMLFADVDPALATLRGDRRFRELISHLWSGGGGGAS